MSSIRLPRERSGASRMSPSCVVPRRWWSEFNRRSRSPWSSSAWRSTASRRPSTSRKGWSSCAGRAERARSVTAEARIPIAADADVVAARQKGREMAAAGGFSGTDQTLIATAISEVARNIVSYAGKGEISLSAIIDEDRGRRGILVIARDDGPGIADTALAMRDGYSTAKSLGLGLPGAKRLMDEFELRSALGAGTTVTMRKWMR